jgi:hypothetical protein
LADGRFSSFFYTIDGSSGTRVAFAPMRRCGRPMSSTGVSIGRWKKSAVLIGASGLHAHTSPPTPPLSLFVFQFFSSSLFTRHLLRTNKEKKTIVRRKNKNSRRINFSRRWSDRKKTIVQPLIIIIVTVTKSYSVYIKYYSKQGEKIMLLVIGLPREKNKIRKMKILCYQKHKLALTRFKTAKKALKK